MVIWTGGSWGTFLHSTWGRQEQTQGAWVHGCTALAAACLHTSTGRIVGQQRSCDRTDAAGGGSVYPCPHLGWARIQATKCGVTQVAHGVSDLHTQQAKT
jgi:hypothetical protein